MATLPAPAKTNFYSLAGELRNLVYDYVFEDVLPQCAPTNGAVTLPVNHYDVDYAAMNVLKPIVNGIFLVSHQVSDEARSYFRGKFFQRRHYIIRRREAIYSFVRIDSPWAHNLHQIHLTGVGVAQGRKIFNPIRVALLKAACEARHAVDSTITLQPRYMIIGAGSTATMLRRFAANMLLGGIPTTLRVYLHAQEKFEVKLVGPLGKLDWTMIAMMRYTEDSEWEQVKARRARILLNAKAEIPLRQMPPDLPEPPAPYVEEDDAARTLIHMFAAEIAMALVGETLKCDLPHISTAT